MENTQSTKRLDAAMRIGIADFGWLGIYTLRGCAELVRARLAFVRLTAREIVDRNTAINTDLGGNSKTRGSEHRRIPSRRHLTRIAYVLPRISHRLPWRSDCLIQAIAGQNWLARSGYQSEVQIGIEHPRGGNFGAHAWLICDGVVVTGGNISRYTKLLAGSSDHGL